MLYRHFPKIANEEISIITATMPGAGDGKAEYSERDLDAFGVNAAYLPAESEGTVPRGFPFPVIVGMPAWDAKRDGLTADWAAARESKGVRPGDYLLADFSPLPESLFSNGAATVLRAAREFAVAAREAAEAGKIAGFGFRLCRDLPQTGDAGYSNAVRAIAGSSEDWAFWSTDYSMANRGELEALVKEMGESGVPLLATDPFFGGRLSNVAPEIHALYYEAPVPRAHEEWALRAIWENQDVVSAVIPPCGTADFAKRCIYAGAGRANSLPESELKVIRAAGEKLLTQEAKYNTFRKD